MPAGSQSESSDISTSAPHCTLLHTSGVRRLGWWGTKTTGLGLCLCLIPNLLILDDPPSEWIPVGEEQLTAILETFNKNLLMVSGVRTLGEMEKVLSESKEGFCP